MPEVSIPAGLRKFFENKTKVTVEAATVHELLVNLEKSYPASRRKLLDSGGSLCKYVRVFVDSEDIAELKNFDTPVGEKSQVKILMALAGG